MCTSHKCNELGATSLFKWLSGIVDAADSNVIMSSLRIITNRDGFCPAVCAVNVERQCVGINGCFGAYVVSAAFSLNFIYLHERKTPMQAASRNSPDNKVRRGEKRNALLRRKCVSVICHLAINSAGNNTLLLPSITSDYVVKRCEHCLREHNVARTQVKHRKVWRRLS